MRASHERWDGDGYPDGIAGEKIPLGARIIAACDAFDAMVTDRPYRKGMPVTEAIEELTRCAGGQFDPQVVESLCRILRDRPVPAETAEPSGEDHLITPQSIIGASVIVDGTLRLPD